MRSRALLVLAISGILGFRFGMVAFPEWQTAVETAQVLAGVVRYPEATPFFIYHTKLWTLLHQVLAVFLWLGVSEVRLSLILSGLLGMISLQALSMFVFALSEDVLLAIGAPLLIMVSRASDFGAVYPIYLMGSVHTYGIAGLSLFVLVVSLLGAGCYRLGGFLLGLAPSIHPSLGIWLFVVVAVCFLWDRRLLSEAYAQGLGYFVAGCLVTGVSLIVHLTSAFPAPPVDSETSARYLSAFVALWDPHRYPVAMGVDGVALNRAALALALLWLAAFTSDLPRSATFLLRVTIGAAILSLLFVMLSWIPPDKLPPSLLILMPARLANFNAMTFVALLIGLLGAYRARAWSPVLALLLTIGLLLGPRSELWSWLQQRGTTAGLARWASWFDVWFVLESVSVGLILLVLTAWNTRRAEKAQPDLNRPWFRVAATSARVALVVLFVSIAVVMWQRAAPRTRLFENYETNPVFREASKGTGLMITGGNLGLVQLRTRRPVLLNGGGLDGLPYSLDAGPDTERILRDVYEIDFFNPPDSARQSGVIPSDYNQKVWEQFSLEKWQTIGYVYRAKQVLTFAGWSLSLPVVAQDRALRLYQIPD